MFVMMLCFFASNHAIFGGGVALSTGGFKYNGPCLEAIVRLKVFQLLL